MLHILERWSRNYVTWILEEVCELRPEGAACAAATEESEFTAFIGWSRR